MVDKLCGQHAAFRYTWPGSDESYCCIDHALQLRAVAEAIGCYVQLIPLTAKVGDPIVVEWPVCMQHIKGDRE